MIILRFILPLAYSVLIGTSYSVIFKKKLSDSIAPAYFLQIMLMLFSAIVFKSVNVGIILGVVIAFVTLGITLYKFKSADGVCMCLREVYCINGVGTTINNSSNINILVLFFTLYIFVYIINYGKYFIKYDEFSHWGIFIKETLRLDQLYCVSQAPMAHKDYVPAGTLFEVLWCRLSLRFSEADSYRGIQMLQVSMLFPLVTCTNKKSNGLTKKTAWVRLFTIIFIPLLISSSPALWFYHTIYKDVIFGIMFFYCMWIAISEENINYAVFVETLALTVMILTKMTALAVLPMVVIFFVVYNVTFNNGKKFILLYILECVLPVSIWFLFNKFVDIFVLDTGSNQSYDSVGTQFFDVITHNGAISWQSDVEKYFFKSLFEWKLIGRMPFEEAVVFVIVALCVMCYLQKDITIKKKIRLLNLWIVLSAIGYSILTLYLYCTAFGEGEARALASFERYMSTYLFTALFIAYATFIFFTDCTFKAQLLVGILILENVLLATGCEQIIPGKLNGEGPKEQVVSSLINEKIQGQVISQEDIILIITGGDDIMTRVYTTYYCSPQKIDCMSVDAVVFNAEGLDPSEDASTIDYSKYSYILFDRINNSDDIEKVKLQKLEDVFDGDAIENGCVYKVEASGDEVKLTRE